ncbi:MULTISPECIES: TolC family outer membrane protein [unclassified Pseudovibrio]|uniref:TolC family outer membrane protein n=1 Tax=unclassified Pseudovibrio TaxID=2627060 RepID=UPI0007AE4471|nr:MULTISPECIES: TolC family outer membrane protein [unclassified Pseudovibrio]KZK95135.1 Outer membrane efflux protein BepC precursor [Pseudovibrio sp. W74]KZL07783.1 Outer membrane efflux protein BepC precursor [Pseudovibrio sp. Ad14]
MLFRGTSVALLMCALGVTSAHSASLRDAVETAVLTNPDIVESAANRRARDQELRASQSAFMPKLSVNASFGAERLRRAQSNTTEQWRAAKQVSVEAEQLLFDGFGSVNEIYRQSARVDGAALRVLERSEAIALDAVEAYVDVVRHQKILNKSKENTALHQRLAREVKERYDGGETGAADLAQVQERVAATRMITASVRKSLLDAMAKYRRVVGVAPSNLGAVSAANSAAAKSLSSALAMSRQSNPLILSAEADTDAAGFAIEQSNSSFMPRVTLNGSANFGDDLNGYEGRSDDYRIMVRLRWNLYNGGYDSAMRGRAVEQHAEAQARVDRMRRETDEAVEQAWASVQTTRERISALRQTVSANQRVVSGYRQEYNIGQRSLLDVLNAENALFNSRIDLISAEYILKFSTYQLQGITGNLLAMFNISPPAESRADRRGNTSIFPQAAGFQIEPLR